MQQTDKYKLNLIERDDVFSPDALNENTQQVEAVLAAESAARAAETQARNALAARVTQLEAHKVYWGTYKGDGESVRFIDLGFTPKALYVYNTVQAAYQGLTVSSDTPISVSSTALVTLAEGGFLLTKNGGPDVYNKQNVNYCFLAFA